MINTIPLSDNIKLAQIYEKYRKLMFTVANEILKDTYLAEDAVQNSFIKLSSNLSKVSEVDNPQTKGYVVTIARNCAKDIYNARHKFSEIRYVDISLTNEIQDQTNPFQKFEMAEIIDLIPRAYLEVLIYKYYQKYTGEEIASTLGISKSTVYKRLERARKILSLKLVLN